MAINLSELDPEDIGSWPVAVKAGLAALIFIVIMVISWFLFISEKRDNLLSIQSKERQLYAQFVEKQEKAANLERYKQQKKDMDLMFKKLKNQLPDKSEIPGLLKDISQTALTTGIKNELFKPGAEAMKDFYAEQPISLKMIGTYHEFGEFISAIASLERLVILTLHDVSLSPSEEEDAEAGDLVLEGTAKTYRHIDDNELVNNP